MSEEEAREELAHVHSNLAGKGFLQSLDEYITEHEMRILDICSGVWDGQRAEDYISKLRAASGDISSQLESAG